MTIQYKITVAVNQCQWNTHLKILILVRGSGYDNMDWVALDL